MIWYKMLDIFLSSKNQTTQRKRMDEMRVFQTFITIIIWLLLNQINFHKGIVVLGTKWYSNHFENAFVENTEKTT